MGWRLAAPVAVCTLVAALSALHVWWLLRFRQGFPVDIDEAGYLWFAFQLNDALEADGPVGLVKAFQGEAWVAPLLPSVTALIEVVGGARGILPSMAVQLVFFAALVVASYGLGRELSGRPAGLVTAGVVATVPAVTDFSRTYHLVIPAAATYTFAAYALVASDRLRDRRWALVWGVALGFTVLSRTMMVAFVPALLAAAARILVVDRADRRRLANLGLALLAFAVVSLAWYAKSWRAVLDYLVDAGYGDESASYGPRLSPASTEYWTHELVGAMNGSLYLPLAVLLLLAFVLAGIGALRDGLRSAQPSLVSRWVRRAANSDAAVPAFVVAEGYLALTSSRNDGTGFVVPLLPSLIVLAVVAAFSLPWQWARIGLVGTLSFVAAFNVVMKADIIASASRVRIVDVPVLGNATVTNGQGYLHRHLVSAAGYRLESPTRWLPEAEKGWVDLYDDVAAFVDRVAGRNVRVRFAFVEPLLNTSAVRLSAYRAGYAGTDLGYVDTRGDDTVVAYRRFLRDESPDVLFTTTREGPQFTPMTQRFVESAAMSVGYVEVEGFPIPDGRRLRAWTCCHTHAPSP